MTIPGVLTLMLLSHIICEFYIPKYNVSGKKYDSDQWLQLRNGEYIHKHDATGIKSSQNQWLLLHCAIHTLCMAVILFAALGLSWHWLFIVLGTGLSHLLIDYLKKYIPKKPFIIDQLLHTAFIFLLWWLFGRSVAIRELYILRTFLDMFGYSPSTNILTFLGLLIILKPVGMLIGSGEIWNFNRDENKPPTETQKGAGKMIGYLERIIVFFLLVNNQFAPIAFVLAAKSVMRFPEIGKSDDASSLVEYYIIGTLLSMTSVFAVAFILGLIRPA